MNLASYGAVTEWRRNQICGLSSKIARIREGPDKEVVKVIRISRDNAIYLRRAFSNDNVIFRGFIHRGFRRRRVYIHAFLLSIASYFVRFGNRDYIFNILFY